MKITLRRTGTIRGIREHLGPIDTKLDVQSEMLEALVMASDFFSLPDEYKNPDVRDGTNHAVAVESDGRSKTVWWTSPDRGDVPAALHDLYTATEKVAIDHGIAWQKDD